MREKDCSGAGHPDRQAHLVGGTLIAKQRSSAPFPASQSLRTGSE